MDLRSFGPYNIFWVTDRSIYCHMTLSAMNYLLYNELISTRATSNIKDANVTNHMFYFHDKYVVPPTDNVSNNTVFVCKLRYIECLIKGISSVNSLINLTYNPTTFRKWKSCKIMGRFCVPVEFHPKN
jgi:hypothetical protein